MADDGVDIRAMTAQDAPACVAIFDAAFAELHRRLRLPIDEDEEDHEEWLTSEFERFLRTDPGLSLVAERDGEVVAFVNALRRDGFWFLSFMFVDPGAQGIGLGRRLLEAVLPPASERASIRLDTAVESFQAVSTALYASHGMAPRTPWYSIRKLDLERLPTMPPGVNAQALSTSDLDDVATLDRDLVGYTRTGDHVDLIASAKEALAYRDDAGRLVGYAYMRYEDWIGPLGSLDESTSLALIADITHRAPQPAKVSLPVLGSSGGIIAGLVGTGSRLFEEGYPFPYVYCSSVAAPMMPGYIPGAAYRP